ncbi:acyl-CoA synthetase (AMP-forming)/AMP-acid ligase II [Rhodococcus rhodochrous J38]|uniref:class I adenylate-forming enzyme family protein n=1 Tax=Rhodococcus rhodochrous TaxID=1829 RepID=UPI0011A3AD48|nr:class I adenylate-forming enzyme family protein [Rhodococcus rhodochrous]TWH62205.1 acyl-CoA synthetase (AMP-forming)/AMP-acid ligase II [Rhodococcus rhodochrous J38]
MTGIREALTLLWSTPDSANMVQEDKTWHTWAQVRDTAERIDAELERLGCGPRSRIGVVLINRTESIASLIAILRHDRVLLTLNPAQPSQRIVEDAVGAHPDVILAPREYWADEEFAAPIAAAGIVGVAVDGSDVSRVFGDAPVPPRPDEQDPVAVEMFTSGTTGPPKRVPLTWRQLEAALEAVHGHTGKGRGDHEPFTGPVALISLSMVHIGGLWGVIQSLSEARPIVLMPRFTVEGWVDAVYEHRMIVAGLPPAAMRSVLNADVPKEKLATLRAITAGTTFVSPELADEFTDRYGIPIMIMYGATEFGGAVAGWTKPLIKQWWEHKRGSVGRPFPGVRMRTVDENGAVLPEGSTGRLEVSSPQTGTGIGDWVRTSDLAHLDEDGFLYIDGRADDAIVRGGFKIQPETVCNALRAHPSVLDASVFGRPDERLGHVPVAVIETVEGAEDVDVDELKTFLRTRLTAYEIPVEIHRVDALPRSVSLKVDRRRLLEMVDEIESSRAR